MTCRRLYTSPEVELHEVQFEGGFLTLSGGGDITDVPELDLGEFGMPTIDLPFADSPFSMFNF